MSIFLFCGKTNSDELTASSQQKSVTSPSFGIISIENNKLSTSFPNSRIPTLLRNISDKDYNLPINNLSAERLFNESDYEASAKELSLNINIVNHNLSQMIDDVLNFNEDTNKTIYDTVIFILVDKWDQLLTEKNLVSSHPVNLGFDTKTIHLINRAMTELMHLQRKGHIIVNKLVSTYLYSCDLKNILKKNTKGDMEKITKS